MKVHKISSFRSQGALVNKTDDMYRVVLDVNHREKVKLINFVEALQNGESTEPSHNSDYAAALWNELNKRCPAGVPEKTDWIPVTRKRLNSAVRNCA